MSFRLVPKSVTLNDLERRNSQPPRNSLNSVAFGTDTIWKYLCMYLDQVNADKNSTLTS